MIAQILRDPTVACLCIEQPNLVCGGLHGRETRCVRKALFDKVRAHVRDPVFEVPSAWLRFHVRRKGACRRQVPLTNAKGLPQSYDGIEVPRLTCCGSSI